MSEKQNNINSLDSLLLLAKDAKARNLQWNRNYLVDHKILELAQKNKVLKYRDMRNMLKIITEAEKRKKAFIMEAEKYLDINKPYSWMYSPEILPIISPQTTKNGLLKIHNMEILKVLEEVVSVKEKYDAYKEITTNKITTLEPIYTWIDTLFHQGVLEEKIIGYKKRLKEKIQTRISKTLIANLIEPQKAEIVKTEGEIPSLTVGEREAFQFLMWKANNMNEYEQTIKQDFLLEGQDEDIIKNGLLIVFEASEALKNCYDFDHQRLSGQHYINLEQNLHKLLEKKRKLHLKNGRGNLELSITLINKLEMKFTPRNSEGILGKTREYIAVRISKDILQLHDKLYTTFPQDHFALMRKTPPKSMIDKTEIAFFDILYQERPINKNKSRILRRIKKTFLILVGGQQMVKNYHQGKVSERIETIYAPKAVNMGLLKKFYIELNKDDQEVYIFEYQDSHVITQLIGNQEKKE